MDYCWILDSGGTGRGAWQGGVIYEFMQWCRQNGRFPSVTMGASAGGYAAADVATGTERTVMKGWTYWGTEASHAPVAEEKNKFRAHLRNSILYVMQGAEMSQVFRENPPKKLLVFTTRSRRRDGKRFGAGDRLRYLLKSATRKLPAPLKYLSDKYREDPVVFALNPPEELLSEFVRPLTPANYHAVIETSCLVPMAMGSPLPPENLDKELYAQDGGAVFLDGGYALKMPMRIFSEDPRFQALGLWASAHKTIIFCCDPQGRLWETSARLRCLNSHPRILQAMAENRLLIIHPDHKIEAGFLCMDNAATMRTFNRGRGQAQRLLRSDEVRRFFDS